ncbi:MAG: four helix bundle protein [Blastocatellia bacterium]|nr:four helix bundle protein [Blastocatellia bacterium]
MSHRENVVIEKSFAFAVRAVRCYQMLFQKNETRPIANQFVRSATSTGANLAEATDAQSRADFISKVSISLKEARETFYWIQLMAATNILTAKQAQSLGFDCEELLKLLTSILKSSRK